MAIYNFAHCFYTFIYRLHLHYLLACNCADFIVWWLYFCIKIHRVIHRPKTHGLSRGIYFRIFSLKSAILVKFVEVFTFHLQVIRLYYIFLFDTDRSNNKIWCIQHLFNSIKFYSTANCLTVFILSIRIKFWV